MNARPILTAFALTVAGCHSTNPQEIARLNARIAELESESVSLRQEKERHAKELEALRRRNEELERDETVSLTPGSADGTGPACWILYRRRVPLVSKDGTVVTDTRLTLAYYQIYGGNLRGECVREIWPDLQAIQLGRQAPTVEEMLKSLKKK